MDVEATWTVSDDVNSLIETILNCKKELTKCCFAKFGAAKISEYVVCAPAKVCELLLLAEGHEKPRDQKSSSYCHKSVADFEQFNVRKTKMFGDNIVRLEAKFEVDNGVGKFWYGNITLT